MKRLFPTLVIFLASITIQAQPKNLTIEECLQKAATHNRELQNAAISLQMAGEQKKEAFTKYFPQISANVLAFKAFDKIIRKEGHFPQELEALAQVNPQLAALAGQPFSIGELDKGYAVMATITQPIFVGGQIVNGNRLANIGKEVAELQLELKTEEVLQKVTENYYQIAKLKFNMKTISSAQAQLQEIYREVKNYVDAGVTTNNDLLKVTLEIQELVSDSIKTAHAKHILSLLLAQQIGMSGEDIEVSGEMDFNSETPYPYYISPEEAINNRKELALAKKGVDANKLKVKMEVGKHLPTVAVGASIFHTGFGGVSDVASSIMETTSNNGMVFGTINVPLSAWWGGSHAIRREKMALKQAENQLQDTRELLMIDIESAWSGLTEAFEQIGVAITSYNEAKENLRMSMEKYRMGTEILSDLLESETMVRKSEDRLASAAADYLIKLADYRRKTR